MLKFPFQNADPSHTGFQYLEDLATAYWYSEVLFASLQSKLFDYLQNGSKDLESLADETGWDRIVLQRLLRVLKKLELVGEIENGWYNNQAAGQYLVSTGEHYLGDFLLYRQYMKRGWETLSEKLAARKEISSEKQKSEEMEADDYEQRNEQYVRAMDTLAREKAREIVSIVPELSWRPPVLDIGGGAGALCRTMLASKSGGNACLFDLPEVIQAARKIYPDGAAWRNIHTISGDFRNHVFHPEQKFGLILLANFLHAYDSKEARRLLKKALSLLLPDGLVVIHDYFPDIQHPDALHKGALYDLTMLLNTYDGACHSAEDIFAWLKACGMTTMRVKNLATDSSLILAAGPKGNLSMQCDNDWVHTAHAMGFRHAVELSVGKIVVATWVREKCRSGCAAYGQKLQCPPHCITPTETQKLLQSYSRALLVEDAPPSKIFHEKLLRLERKAFLSGFHKAFVFGAGPCPVCDVCPESGVCRKPEKARPSMEGAGMDVYSTVRNAGLSIQPVHHQGDYVKYFGLLLLE